MFYGFFDEINLVFIPWVETHGYDFILLQGVIYLIVVDCESLYFVLLFWSFKLKLVHF